MSSKIQSTILKIKNKIMNIMNPKHSWVGDEPVASPSPAPDEMPEKQGASPSPKVSRPEPETPETMDFYAALKEMVKNRKATKLEWNNKKIYGALRNERLTLYKEDGKSYDWILTLGDLSGDDYIIIN